MSTLKDFSFVNEFSLKTFQKITPRDENCVFSPLSISMALQMCYIGAKNKTALQLRHLLCLTDDSNAIQKCLDFNKQLLRYFNKELNDDNNVKIEIGNKLFALKNYEIVPGYLKNLIDHFDSSIETVDFKEASKSAKIINDWVEKKTNNKIRDLIQADMITDMTRLILVNAIYFKGLWKCPFTPNLTCKQDFVLASGSKIPADMMRLYYHKLKLQKNPEGLKCSTCELSYSNDKLAMTIILPDYGVNLDEFEKKLSLKSLQTIVNSKKKNVRLANVYLPKFKIDFSSQLTDALKSLGCIEPFDQEKADFSDMVKPSLTEPRVYISDVIHKAFIEVNEKGTEAAAATAVVVNGSCSASSGPQAVDFICNRPFLFVLHEVESQVILFMGKVMHPKSE